ncbi:MAG: L,D-transpeptidase family protein [Deltaproteobacteria bacterium]|nr:L,D-transpeptidase family protein [Deltaproteobacteria bacterium]
MSRIQSAFLLIFLLFPGSRYAGALQEKPEIWEPGTKVYSYGAAINGSDSQPVESIIGEPVPHKVQQGETLLDIARRHHLGYLELIQANPGVDPWVPPVGLEIKVPSTWILPRPKAKGFVLNIPEMRLYYYLSDTEVMTFPLGIGMEGWDTPAGKYRIGEKRKNPIWYVPKSIQAEMDEPRSVIPPGPENPLGSYWMRLSHTSYGIHGTNNPWAVGRKVTHGCLRLYPEDIAFLYPRVSSNLPVEIMYKRAKVGFKEGQPYFQVYRYQNAEDGILLVELIQAVRDLELDVDLRRMRELLRGAQDGALIPVPLK